MGWNIEGHGQCVICRPWLVTGWEKRYAKGKRLLPHKVAVKSQESERLLDLLSRAEQETIGVDDD